MKTLISLAVAGALLAGVAAEIPARAEVSAEVDAYGTYVRTVVLSSASLRSLKIWTVARARAAMFQPLNPDGDLNGDLWPFIAENPYDANRPWVVWSRFNGRDYDLAWSRWTPAGWSPVEWVEHATNLGDDMDPFVAIGPDSRPYVTWWRGENGIGRVYFSVFLATAWGPATPVSDPDVDSRSPVITVEPDGTIVVQFDTPGGPVTRRIKLILPTTITDDIIPIGQSQSSSAGNKSGSPGR